jgi:hypothetical protein
MGQKRRPTAAGLDRWKTLNAFVATDMAALTTDTKSGSAALVWFTLFSLADGRTGKLPAKVSARWVSKLTGLGRNAVLRALDSLSKRGFIDLNLTPRGMTCMVRHHEKESK